MTSLQTITATAKEWIAALNRLTPATTGKKPMPILSMVHVDPTTAAMSAVGGDVSAETGLAASVGKGSPFLVSYAWLRDAIMSTTGRNCGAEVKVTSDGKHATVEAMGYKLSVETMAVTDFPERFKVGTVASHSAVDAVELRDLLGRALLAASKDDTLPILASVHISSAPHGLRMLATDRYRLVSGLVVGPGVGEEEFTLPAAALKLMVKQFKAGSIYVDSTEGGPVIFKTDDATYMVTPIVGSYPQLEQLFDITPATVADVDRVQLLEAAKVARRMSERYTPVFLSITKAGAQVTFNGGLFGPDVAPLATGTLKGNPADLAFNPGFLLEAMNSFKGDTVRIHGANPARQFSFIDGGADVTDATIYRHMVMTIRMPRD